MASWATRGFDIRQEVNGRVPQGRQHLRRRPPSAPGTRPRPGSRRGRSATGFRCPMPRTSPESPAASARSGGQAGDPVHHLHRRHALVRRSRVSREHLRQPRPLAPPPSGWTSYAAFALDPAVSLVRRRGQPIRPRHRRAVLGEVAAAMPRAASSKAKPAWMSTSNPGGCPSRPGGSRPRNQPPVARDPAGRTWRLRPRRRRPGEDAQQFQGRLVFVGLGVHAHLGEYGLDGGGVGGDQVLAGHFAVAAAAHVLPSMEIASTAVGSMRPPTHATGRPRGVGRRGDAGGGRAWTTVAFCRVEAEGMSPGGGRTVARRGRCP